MIKHIVGWNFKEELSQQENYSNAKKVKEELEGLKAKIRGIEAMEVIIEPLKSRRGHTQKGPVWWLPKEEMWDDKKRPTEEELKEMVSKMRCEINALIENGK